MSAPPVSPSAGRTAADATARVPGNLSPPLAYGPDFIPNAGGLINIAVELEGYDPTRARLGR